MKHLLGISLCFLSLSLFAQRDRTLFNGNYRTGFFGAPIFEFYDINSGTDFEVASGGGGALIIGDAFIGGYGIGDINLIQTIENDRADIDLAHGGIWVGYVPLQQSAIHPYLSARVGWGAADIVIDDDNFTFGDRFFVVSPEAGVELNVFRWFRIAGTVGYQWFDGLPDTGKFGDLDINNLRAGLTLRFGAFGRSKKGHSRNNWW
ncbi:MAG: hypothetical protein AAGI23_08670 [Bacteroidota bacterium]